MLKMETNIFSIKNVQKTKAFCLRMMNEYMFKRVELVK